MPSQIVDLIVEAVRTYGLFYTLIAVMSAVFAKMLWDYSKMRVRQQEIDKEREDNYTLSIVRADERYEEMNEKYEALYYLYVQEIEKNEVIRRELESLKRRMRRLETSYSDCLKRLEQHEKPDEISGKAL